MRIQAIPVGFDNVYAVQDEGTILVDGGQPGYAASLAHRLARADVVPERVGLVVITHGHWDHIGCAAALRRLTHAPLAVHESEQDRLECGRVVMPAGVTPWGKVFGAALAQALRFVRIEPTSVDVPIGDEGLPLGPYGIPGKVVHTPGHSPGSVSIVLDGGNALVGDLAMNRLPLRLGPGLPIFAEQPALLRGSIEKLLAQGVKTIYPAHGRSFPASVLEKALRSLPT